MADFGSLVTFRDLEIRGTEDALGRMGDQLEATLPPNVWQRNKEKENDYREMGGGSDQAFVFTRKPVDDLPHAGLVLVVSSGSATVSNIVPLEVSELSKSQYNAILEDFLTAGLRHVAGTLGLHVKVTEANRPMTDWLSQAAAKKLQAFSRAANKSTGSAHPSDRERWLSFIIQAHQDRCQLSASMLTRWLIEVERWSDDLAHDLAIEYEFGRDLLNQSSRSVG